MQKRHGLVAVRLEQTILAQPQPTYDVFFRSGGVSEDYVCLLGVLIIVSIALPLGHVDGPEP